MYVYIYICMYVYVFVKTNIFLCGLLATQGFLRFDFLIENFFAKKLHSEDLDT